MRHWDINPLIGVVLLALLFDKIVAFKTGAPDSPTRVCKDLMPGHHISAQTSASPYQISALETSYSLGQDVTVTISSSNGTNIKGFLIQARKASDGTPVGAFQESTAIKLTCESIKAPSATHNNSEEKSSVTAMWKASEDYGDIIFHATVVQEYAIFWVDIKSSVITSGAAPSNDLTDFTTASSITSTSPAKPTSAQPTVSSTGEDVDTSTCSTAKACLREPQGCATDDCKLLATWKNADKGIECELSSKADSASRYVAFALSKDQTMGSDTVINCLYDNKNQLIIRTSLNVGKSNQAVDDDGKLILKGSTSGGYKNGRLFCRFTLLKSQETASRRKRQTASDFFYPDTNKYFVLLAAGPASAGSIDYHGADRMFSYESIDFLSATFGDEKSAGSGDRRLVKAHAILMIFAWMVFASFGVLLPKYYKSTWSETKWCGKPVWFQLHQPLMVLTLVLTIAAFIIVFVKVGGYSQLPAPTDAHPPLGIIVMILALANPIMAIFRCAPDAPLRPIFNVFHSIVGYLAHFAAIVTVFLGLYMKQLNLPDWCRWIMVAFICWHVLIEILLRLAEHCQRATRNLYHEGDNGQLTFEHGFKPTVDDDDMYKTLVLVLHFIGVTGFSIAMSVQIGIS